jgi:pSer/pThr/pTyr-binding forkhead associated (FHA) protein
VLSLKGRQLKRHLIARPFTTVGRDPTNDVHIDNVGVSRHHASVVARGDDFVVLDASSANGIFVNGEACKERPLRHGDQIQVGKYTLVFIAEGGLTARELQDKAPEERTRAVPHLGRGENTFALSADEIDKVLAKTQQARLDSGRPLRPPPAAPLVAPARPLHQPQPPGAAGHRPRQQTVPGSFRRPEPRNLTWLVWTLTIALLAAAGVIVWLTLR